MNLRGFWKDANAGNFGRAKNAKPKTAPNKKSRKHRRVKPTDVNPATSMLAIDASMMRQHFRSI